jgi:hypothetical protein
MPSLLLFMRLAMAAAAFLLSYSFWRHVMRRLAAGRRTEGLLIGAYVLTRAGGWLVFALFLQQHVIGSDPSMYYTPMLKGFLAGRVPIRDFFYPYGPLLIPSILPFYVLLGQTLAGISLFAILAEAVALAFFLKSARLLADRGEADPRDAQRVMAVYLLNPATLYWVVLHGYHSGVQTAYSMAALYFLLKGSPVLGYGVGLFSLAGTKFLAVLDWPALLAVRRPKIASLLLGAIPLLITYAAFQAITGDSLFPLRYHLGYISEGNVWFLLTLFRDMRGFYLTRLGGLLPVLLFGVLFSLGFWSWMKRPAFSFRTAIGATVFTVSLFFLCSLYTGDYYVPMLMLPASVVVASGAERSRALVWTFLAIATLSLVGDAIWMEMDHPVSLREVFASAPPLRQWLAVLLTGTILLRIACLCLLARAGLRFALGERSPARG